MKVIPALVALALVPSPAAAAPTFFAHPKGGLSAPTELRATSGCIDRGAFMWPMQNPDGTRAVFAEITQYDHCAVLIAEDITSRFLNVVSLFNGTIPLIAIQMQALKIGDSVTLIFTTVMDELNDALDASFPATDPLTLDLSWTGSGRQYSDNVLYENGHSDGVTVINHDHEMCRDASVSGTVDGAGGYDVVDSRLCRQVAGSLFLFIE